MSYNCLAPSLAAKNMYLYNTQQRKHGRDVLSWSFRGPNLVKDIAARKSEIVCLQEIDDVCFQYFEQQMTQLGYKGTYVRCTGAKIDGVALFAKSSIFEVDACEHINYHPNKDNAAIVMILSIPHLKRKICVATTHLVWSPKRGEVKLAQIQMLTERMRLLVQTHEAKINATIPVVLCGDFNLTPASMLYHFLTTGVMDIRDGSNKTMSGQFSRALAYVGKDSASFPFRAACHEGIMANAGQENIIPVSIQPKVTPPQHSAIISHPFDFASVYAPYKHPTDGSRMFTSWHDSDQDLVDFIFFGGLNTTSSATTDPQQRQRYQQTVLECLRCLATPLAQQCGKMPSPSAPSDHIPLVAQFRLSIV
ncbi:Endonuclease/exonuclease/phosphatase [Phlyctochytrium arcticum]|nr:Endonuclease/exonuclease/phosphatase [Phlyctochytrium arcticum]